jgi:polyisoprenoid-binding protein YceI
MRLAFRMADHEVLHVISSSSDSSIVAEVLETRLMRKYRYFLSFESFKGELHHSPKHPENSRLTLEIDAKSVLCRDRSLRKNRQRRVTAYVRDQVLNASAHPVIQFASHQISAKPLRGLVVEGLLSARGTTGALKMNAVFTSTGNDRLEIDGDATFLLSGFGITAPSAFFGMVKTSDEILIHLRLYARPESFPG